MLNKALFSSAKEDWETPDDLFQYYDKLFKFQLDVAADKYNKKCSSFWSEDEDGLFRAWSKVNWCNPPYGKQIYNWVKRAKVELDSHDNTTIMLLPARTDTKWFHEFIYHQKNVEIRFIKGRLKFKLAKYSAPFPSMIVIFRGSNI